MLRTADRAGVVVPAPLAASAHELVDLGLDGGFHHQAQVDPPQLDQRAHHKSYQLAVTTEVGLVLRPTLVTKDPDAAGDHVLIGSTGPASGAPWSTAPATRHRAMAGLLVALGHR